MPLSIELQELGIRLNSTGYGSHKTRCPKCSESRKNKADESLYINIKSEDGKDRAAIRCYNCGWTAAVPTTFQATTRSAPKKGAQKPSKKPEFIPPTGMAKEALDWFQKRAIPQVVVAKNKIKYDSQNRELQFPYFSPSGEVVNIKYRKLDEKKFRLFAGGKLMLFGLQNINPDYGTCIITEGECLPLDAEILTPQGWLRIGEYSNQLVMQVNDAQIGRFVKPEAYIRKSFSGNLIKHETRGWVSITTPKHNLAVLHRGRMIKRTAESDIPANYHTPRACVFIPEGCGIPLSDDEIRLCLAISADATFYPRKTVNPYVKISVKKERKKIRLRKLLDSCGVSYKESFDNIKENFRAFQFSLPSYSPGRMLPWEWIEQATPLQRKVIIDELTLWDGNFVPNRNQTEYSSKYYENALWVQTLAHLSGFCSMIIKRKNEIGKWFKVSLLHGKHTSSWQSVHTIEIPYEGDVACVRVPSGMILIRQEGKISITGNCDALALQACGFENAFSVPNGAAVTDGDNAPKLEYLANSEELLKGFNKIFLCCDMDEAGQALEYELARRLGFGRCLRVELPLKDANEVLIQRGVDELCGYIHDAQPFPLSGVSTWADLERDTFAFYDSGARPGKLTGWDNVDNYYTVREGELSVVTGVPSSGKSEFIDALIVNLAKSQGWSFGIFSPENMPLTEHISKLCSKYLGKPYTKSSYTRFSREDLATAMAWGHSHFYHIIQQQVEDKATIEWILDKAQGLVYRYGIKGLVIDPYNEIEHNRKAGQSETEYISEMLAKVKRFARSFDIHIWIIAHPAKPNHIKNTKTWVPNLYDISGGANWRNKADAGIIVHRSEKSDNDREVKIIIDKIRFRQVGKRGETKLYYDPYTGIYKVPESEGVIADYYEAQEDN